MSNPSSQIFQTTDARRWKNFRWSLRVLLFIMCFFLVVLVIALVRGFNPSLPDLQAQSKEFQQKLDPSNPLTLSTIKNKKYKGFKDQLNKRKREDSLKNLHN